MSGPEYFFQVAKPETVMLLGFNYFELTWRRTLPDGTEQTLYQGEVFKALSGGENTHQVVVAENLLAGRTTWQLACFRTKAPENCVNQAEREAYWQVLDQALEPIEPEQIEQKLLDYYEQVTTELFGP